jgi:exodeoxyribonuclease VII small subunit
MSAAIKKPRADDAEPANYEQALAELEQLVGAMEAGQLPLDGLLAHYQRCARLLSYCRDRLAAVENQVKLLEDGQLKDWTGLERG